MIWLIRGGRVAAIVRTAAPLAIVGTVFGVVSRVLRRFPPTQNSFYPRCPIYEALHLKCPGCGATRALAALLQGRFDEAMHLNAFAMLLLSVAAAYGLYWYWRFVRRGIYRGPNVSQEALYVALAAASVFTVLRNLPLRLLQ
ncbi:DUF2752 domain-containing protein [Tunturibacter empetritectus]|uniref:DUF2752 domain-containing protein n=1 Tax=Tunturiibacter lichenicola TaxID=2051959 RepID=A0A7W8N2B3_9BACT|nr:DUF2752 domain-containing protein [Edaphobacter lichenicola]MBB5342228.1 hypothetical protein [Edaphobacter lichenicola]